MHTYAGVPQGSILGPLLFLIFINDMLSNVTLECHQYADDTTFLLKTNKPSDISTIINPQLHMLSIWATQWRVMFNTNKTHYMYITNKTTKPHLSPIFLNNVSITEVYSHNNLGLTITSNLSWKDHINKIIEKAHNRLNCPVLY